METFYIVLIITASIIGIVIAAWIFSLFFQVKETLKRQKIQIHLLYKIAEQAGGDKVELKQIVRDVIAVY